MKVNNNGSDDDESVSSGFLSWKLELESRLLYFFVSVVVPPKMSSSSTSSRGFFYFSPQFSVCVLRGDVVVGNLGMAFFGWIAFQ